MVDRERSALDFIGVVAVNPMVRGWLIGREVYSTSIGVVAANQRLRGWLIAREEHCTPLVWLQPIKGSGVGR